MDKIYTPEELAQAWKVSLITIYKLIGQNKIPHFRVGRAYRIPEDPLRTYMQREGNLESFALSFVKGIPQAAQCFLSLLKKEPKSKRDNVISIQLYGSYARGTATQDSDIDLLMVVKRLDSKIERWIASLNDQAMALVDYNQLLSILRMSENHWKEHKKLKSPLSQEIEKDGIWLWPLSKSLHPTDSVPMRI